MKVVTIIFLCGLACALPCTSPCFRTELLAEFVVMDYDWSGSGWATRQDAITSGAFIPQNNIITGINVFGDTVYVTVPRWRSGVPSTLNVLENNGTLRPFPSWEWQRGYNLHYVQSVFVDAANAEMWIIDTGRENFFDADPATAVNRLARLFVINIRSLEVTLNYTFPEDVLPSNTSFLNDIKVDTKRQRAFMTDTNLAGKGAVIAFDRATLFSRRFEDPSSTYAEQDVLVRINGVSYPKMASPADGVEISSDCSTVFYSSVRGQLLHAISASLLLTPNATFTELRQNVSVVYNKGTPSDGLLTIPFPSGDGLLYGAENEVGIAIVAVEASKVVPVNSAIAVMTDAVQLQWADTFALRVVPNVSFEVYFTTNRLQLYFAGTMSFNGSDGSNFRMFRMTLPWNATAKKDVPHHHHDDDDWSDQKIGEGVAIIVVGCVVIILAVRLCVMRSLKSSYSARYDQEQAGYIQVPP